MIFKNPKIYDNLKIYCEYHQKDFDTKFNNLKKRECESIKRGNISDRLVNIFCKELHISKKQMDFMLKYDLTDCNCRFSFFCNDFDLYEGEQQRIKDALEWLDTQIASLKCIIYSIRNQQNIKLLNSLDPYCAFSVTRETQTDSIIKYRLSSDDYISAHVFLPIDVAIESNPQPIVRLLSTVSQLFLTRPVSLHWTFTHVHLHCLPQRTYYSIIKSSKAKEDKKCSVII